MKIGIMQPYFLPYLGYFSLIKNTDSFILLDSVQYIKSGWIERNRILHPQSGWMYFRVPLMPHNHTASIKELKIDNRQNWKQKFFSQLQHYKKAAPHFVNVMRLLNDILNNDYDTIVNLNKTSLEAVCNFLGIERTCSIFSRMNLPIDTPKAPDEWSLNICRSLGNVQEYWNPPGGQSFYDRDKYERAGLKLKFHKIVLQEYGQRRSTFESGLSIVDVIMFNEPSVVNRMLDQFELL
jgi:hypothetical protein